MTEYRCVCPQCTAYISSGSEPIPWEGLDEWQNDWHDECEQWLAEHECGVGPLDGIEKPSEFARFEQVSPYPQKQAQEQYIRDLAAERGLTTKQLEARIVGDLCGYLPLEIANILLGMLEAARRVNGNQEELEEDVT